MNSRDGSRDGSRDASSLKSGVAAGGGGPTCARASANASSADIEGWLLQRLQSRLGAGAEVVDRHMPFSYYGLDSIDAVELAAELEDWLGQPVSATLTFDYPTVSAVATYLAAEAVSAPAADGADVAALLAELDGPRPDRLSP